MKIMVEHLSKSYGSKAVFTDFSANFFYGEITCLMGASGAGKTTLLRLMMGLEKPDAGAVRGIEGHAIGAVFQEDRLCENLSAISNIRLVAAQRTKAEVLAALQQAGLGDCLLQPVRELSGGMRRRVALLRALLSGAEILFLDEPFKGLDDETKITVMQMTKQYAINRTVIFVTHDEKEAIFAAGAVITMP